MQNIDNWEPSKYVYKNGKLKASLNKNEVNIGSRLVTNLTAQFYNSALSKYAKGDLLDLGCGKVPLFEAYKNKVNSCMCVDWANSLHKNNFLDMNVDLNKPLPFDNSTFDTIILSDVLEHIQNPIKLWNEMNRILRKNGVLIMNVPFHYWIHEHPFDYYRYTQYALENFAKDSGFKVVSINKLGGVIEVLTDFISKISCKVPFVGKFHAMFIQWLNLQFLEFRIGKKILNTTSQNFVLSYALIARKK